MFPFCYHCTFLKRCDRLRSVPFYYRSPFCFITVPFHFITVLRFVLLPFSVSFFCRLRLSGTVSPPFLFTCNTYVCTSYVHHRDSDKTYASCWLARVTIGSLVLRCLRHTTITRSRWLYTYYHRQGVKPGDISRKLQQKGIKAPGRGIAKFLAKLIKSASVARKPGSGRPSKQNRPCNGTKRTVERNETDRGTARNGAFYAVFRKTLSPCNANRTDRF